MNLAVIGKGRMGQLIRETAEANGDTVVAMADGLDHQPLEDNLENIDVILDFSHPSALEWLLETAGKAGIPLVLGTTGYTDEQKAAIARAAENQPVFFSANYSLGIAMLSRLVKEAAQNLDWDIEIIEKHHNQKADAPSGTALALAEAADPDHEKEWIYGRSGQCGKRGDEIGIHAVRGGTIAGMHDVLFIGPQEILTLSHEAENRQIFVNGALKAAAFMEDKPAGFYNMDSLLEA